MGKRCWERKGKKRQDTHTYTHICIHACIYIHIYINEKRYSNRERDTVHRTDKRCWILVKEYKMNNFNNHDELQFYWMQIIHNITGLYLTSLRYHSIFLKL